VGKGAGRSPDAILLLGGCVELDYFGRRHSHPHASLEEDPAGVAVVLPLPSRLGRSTSLRTFLTADVLPYRWYQKFADPPSQSFVAGGGTRGRPPETGRRAASDGYLERAATSPSFTESGADVKGPNAADRVG
jgi:hypothetical protein